ncbi:MAG: DUF4250 domain-containing protein [Clostridia bacterium]|nr:DUF4250 domain-containing protein [Clostridia bacterium]
MTYYQGIPKDPFILLGVINTRLRDEYKNLESLCEGIEVEEVEIVGKLRSIGYGYDPKTNQFTSA